MFDKLVHELFSSALLTVTYHMIRGPSPPPFLSLSLCLSLGAQRLSVLFVRANAFSCLARGAPVQLQLLKAHIRTLHVNRVTG
jgi:hypothetical protein